jgi:hypothetical protein
MTYSIVLEQENDVPFAKWNAAEQAPSTGHKKRRRLLLRPRIAERNLAAVNGLRELCL